MTSIPDSWLFALLSFDCWKSGLIALSFCCEPDPERVCGGSVSAAEKSRLIADCFSSIGFEAVRDP